MITATTIHYYIHYIHNLFIHPSTFRSSSLSFDHIALSIFSYWSDRFRCHMNGWMTGIWSGFCTDRSGFPCQQPLPRYGAALCGFLRWYQNDPSECWWWHEEQNNDTSFIDVMHERHQVPSQSAFWSCFLADLPVPSILIGARYQFRATHKCKTIECTILILLKFRTRCRERKIWYTRRTWRQQKSVSSCSNCTEL